MACQRLIKMFDSWFDLDGFDEVVHVSWVDFDGANTKNSFSYLKDKLKFDFYKDPKLVRRIHSEMTSREWVSTDRDFSFMW